jgi:hypothetical protein
MLASEDKRLTSSLPRVNLGRSRLFSFGFVALLGVVVVLLGRLILLLHPCVVGVGPSRSDSPGSHLACHDSPAPSTACCAKAGLVYAGSAVSDSKGVARHIRQAGSHRFLEKRPRHRAQLS